MENVLTSSRIHNVYIVMLYVSLLLIFASGLLASSKGLDTSIVTFMLQVFEDVIKMAIKFLIADAS